MMLFVVILSMALMTSTQSRELTIVKGVAKRGTISDQDLQVLSTQDLSGTTDNWNKYVEVSAASSSKFIAQFEFKYESQSTDGSISQIQISVNSIGVPHGDQRRWFTIRNFATRRWETLGDNAGAQDWKWFAQTYSLDSGADYLNPSNNIVRVRYISNNNADVSNLDQLKVDVIFGATAPPPTPSPTTAAPITATPTAAPITSTPTAAPITSTPTATPITSTPTAAPITSTPTTSAPTTATVTWWQPKSSDALTWQWQIQNTVDTSFDVDMYDIDLFDTTVEKIQALKDDGRIVVCYFSAGTFEGWRADWQQHFSFITSETYNGNQLPFAGNMADWDERWLDIREIELLTPIMRARLQLAKDKGCDAVEPDNMDAYTNGGETGIGLTYNDQLAYNRWLAAEAHAIGMSIGLKNDVDQLADLVDYFDWALNEQCFQYNECGDYEVYFTAQDKAVFGVEYSGSPSSFCPQAQSMGLSWLKKRLHLKAWRRGCEDF